MLCVLVAASFTGSASKTTPLNEFLAAAADARLIRVHAVESRRGDGKEACGHCRRESPDWKNLGVTGSVRLMAVRFGCPGIGGFLFRAHCIVDANTDS